MAQPIPLTLTPKGADPTERLADALHKHTDAIVSALELLQLLHDRGVLNLLRGLVGAGDQLAGKCSLVWDESGTISHNLRAASIRKEAEASLKRLGLDAIDLYQIHWPAWKGNPESASPGSIEEAVGELAKLKAEGKIRNIGVSNFDAQQMARAVAVAAITSLQPPYSLLATEVEHSIFHFTIKHQIGVIVYSQG